METVKPSEEMKIDHMLKRMVARWYADGATHEQVGDELDMRILTCGAVACKFFMRDPDNFTLTKFFYMALKWSYAILRRYGKVADWRTADFSAAEAEYQRWRIDFTGSRKSELVMSILALEVFAEVQMTGISLVLKPNKEKTNGSSKDDVR